MVDGLDGLKGGLVMLWRGWVKPETSTKKEHLGMDPAEQAAYIAEVKAELADPDRASRLAEEKKESPPAKVRIFFSAPQKHHRGSPKS